MGTDQGRQGSEPTSTGAACGEGAGSVFDLLAQLAREGAIDVEHTITVRHRGGCVTGAADAAVDDTTPRSPQIWDGTYGLRDTSDGDPANHADVGYIHGYLSEGDTVVTELWDVFDRATFAAATRLRITPASPDLSDWRKRVRQLLAAYGSGGDGTWAVCTSKHVTDLDTADVGTALTNYSGGGYDIEQWKVLQGGNELGRLWSARKPSSPEAPVAFLDQWLLRSTYQAPTSSVPTILERLDPADHETPAAFATRLAPSGVWTYHHFGYRWTPWVP